MMPPDDDRTPALPVRRTVEWTPTEAYRCAKCGHVSRHEHPRQLRRLAVEHDRTCREAAGGTT
jgi:hypothetical protein